MKNFLSSKKATSSQATAKSSTPATYRFGAVLSAAAVVLSLFSGLVTQLGSKMGATEEQVKNMEEASARLPYEAPTFQLFKNIFVSDATAGAPPCSYACAYDPP